MSKRNVLYYGCIGESGHHLWQGEGVNVTYRDLASIFPFPWDQLDGQRFTPGRLVRGRWEGWPETQSACKLTHEADWTFVGCWDRTVDKRPGSNSTFIVPGTHSFEEAIALARAVFPETMARIEKRAPLVMAV